MSECRIWKGRIDREGYGRMGSLGAHVAAWSVAHNRYVPKGYELHHTCENKACINPEHLRLVTRKQHRRLHRKSHCAHGHALRGENLYVTPNGRRKCRECNRGAARQYQRNRKERSR